MRLFRLSDELLRKYVAEQSQLDFTYRDVGGSSGASPEGFAVDHNRVCLGQGSAVFGAACQAMRAWRMYPGAWTFVFPADTPLEPGRVVAIQAKAYGLWWLNACRIVYVVDDAPRRFGFAYGTLPGHVECGEEQFLIERDAEDRIWYDIRAFSRPRHPLVRRAAPWARRLQHRFVRDSKAAMLDAVQASSAMTRQTVS